jgi:hypothetical protein
MFVYFGKKMMGLMIEGNPDAHNQKRLLDYKLLKFNEIKQKSYSLYRYKPGWLYRKTQ